jgi:hypothetical protein
MKSYAWWMCLAVVVAGVALAGTARVVGAEEEENEQHEHMAAPGQMPMAPHLQPPVRVTLSPAMEGVIWHTLKIAKASLLVIFACHILLAVWIFLDIRKRGEGHGIFIALALLAGFCAAILYALVRLADMRKT